MVGAGGNAPRGRLPRSFRADGFTDRPGDRHPKAFGNSTASRCCPGAARFWRPRCAMLAPAARRTPHAGTRTQTVRFLRPVPLHWATWGRKDCGDRSRTGGARLMRPGGGPPLPANSMIDGAPARYLAGAPSLATTCPDFRPRARKSWPGRGPPQSGPHAARHRHLSAGVRSIARSGQSPPGRQVFSLARDPGSRVALRPALCRSPVSRGSRAPAGRYLTKNKHPCPAYRGTRGYFTADVSVFRAHLPRSPQYFVLGYIYVALSVG